MKKVGVAELKARLSEYLRAVKGGQEVTIVDRNQPVARVLPYRAADLLTVREPTGTYRRLSAVPLPKPVRLKIDPVDLLLEDRARER
ncbi:MAG TPA: type II toxin-antitoxin system prevent-host-death family antitoxin [Gemmatimonadales bacterium]